MRNARRDPGNEQGPQVLVVFKDKVLRSMAAGLPCIGTPEAFRGMQDLPTTVTGMCEGEAASDLAAAIVRMHSDESANTSCAETGLNYIAAFFNEARVNALIGDIAQPALDRHGARARPRSECQILSFGMLPQHAEAIAAEAKHRRVVFG
jgi:hypothetical protein